jgi:hypothetical protein
VNFYQHPPSNQWAALKYQGEKFAEVWFKPEGEPLGVAFRIPRESFAISGIGELLTPENLLKAVAIATEDVESWRHGDDSNPTHGGGNGSVAELMQPLSPPPQEVSHLSVHVLVKPPQVAPDQTGAPEFTSTIWEHLESRWKAILAQEALIETLRLNLQGLRGEMDASAKKSLSIEEKIHALNADVAQWTRAKSRVHFAQPKVNDFVHRATWAEGTPERKKLEELHESHIKPHVPFVGLQAVLDELENLLKERQVLAAQGNSVAQECRTVITDAEGALRTLQANAAVNARRKIDEHKPKGKFFKHVRRWSGAE